MYWGFPKGPVKSTDSSSIDTVIQVLMEETDLKAGDSDILHFNLWAVIEEKAVFEEVYYEPCLKL